MKVELLANEKGHRFFWSSPCFSDFNPIELLWAYTKRNKALQSSNSTALADAYRILTACLEHLNTVEGSVHIVNMFSHVEMVMHRFSANMELEVTSGESSSEYKEEYREYSSRVPSKMIRIP